MSAARREQGNRTYQPNEGHFEREDYAQDLNLSDPDEPGEVIDSFSSRNSLDSYSSCPRQRHSAEEHTPRQVYAPLHSSISPGIVAMLQEQQGTLQRILKQQQNLCVLVKHNERKVKVLGKSFKRLNEENNSLTSSSAEKNTLTVTRDLTVSVNLLYLHVHTCIIA